MERMEVNIMEEGKIRYCVDCGVQLDDDQIIKLRNGETVVCSTCGNPIRYYEEKAEDMMEQVREDIEEAMEAARETIEEADDEIREAIDEAQEILEEAQDLMEEAASASKLSTAVKKKGKAIAKADKARAKVIKSIEKAKRRMAKARAKSERIDLTVPKGMKNEWKGLAGKLSVSVSELVRKAMKVLESNMGNIEKIGEEIEKAVRDSGIEEIGDKIEKAVKDSGLEDLGKNFERKFEGHGHTEKKTIEKNPEQIKADRERKKKRVIGLLKIRKNLPIDKFAKILNKSLEEAEELIYEIAAEDIDCTIDDGVCKFDTDLEKVIPILSELIDNMD